MSDAPKLHNPVTTDEPSTTGIFFQNMIRGGIIYDAEMARRFGEILLEAHYSKEELAELARQRPLIAEDKGAYWRVIGIWGILHTPPEVQAYLEGRGELHFDPVEKPRK